MIDVLSISKSYYEAGKRPPSPSISTRSYSWPLVGVVSICTSFAFMGKHLARMQKTRYWLLGGSPLLIYFV